MTRSERLLQTIPPNLRQEFAAVLSTSLPNAGMSVLGLRQPVQGNETLRQREPYREEPYAISEDGRRLPKNANRGSLHGAKLSDKLRAAGMSRDGAPGLTDEGVP